MENRVHNNDNKCDEHHKTYLKLYILPFLCYTAMHAQADVIVFMQFFASLTRLLLDSVNFSLKTF